MCFLIFWVRLVQGRGLMKFGGCFFFSDICGGQKIPRKLKAKGCEYQWLEDDSFAFNTGSFLHRT